MGARRPKVLIVENDDALALSLHGALYTNTDRFDVITVRTVDVGQAIMREVLIDVLVTDVNLPDLGGPDLVYWAAIESPETYFVAISDHPVERVPNHACAVGCLRILTKPVDSGVLLSSVTDAIDCRERMSGRLSALSALDLIQTLCLGRKNASLRITSGDVIGSLLIREGVLVHAIWGERTGEAAVRAIVAIDDGVFRTSPLPENFERTIHRDWEHVVMDAVRMLDESSPAPPRAESGTWPTLRADDAAIDEVFEAIRGTSPGGKTIAARRLSEPPTDRTQIEPQRASSALVDKGFAALRVGDVALAKTCWEAAQRLEPANRSIELNLRRLGSIQSG
jgi:FixJ family two-component response regulator